MSVRKIKSELKKKGFKPILVEYERGCPTPSGYGNGYNIVFEEDVELLDRIYDYDPDVEFSSYMEIDTLEEVLEWIEELPDLKEL